MGLLVACCLALASRAHAGDPQLRWRSIETEHFRITYHEPLGAAVQRLAVVAESAHALLVPLLDHSPRFRTEVLLTDDTDSSNGSATALPYNQVRLYMTAPDDRSELNDYDDWLFALFVHEYTHVLHLDTVNGLPKWINLLLGFGVNTLYAPNQVQPRWFIEGLAVFEETERTSAGRLRSTLFDMYLRSHVLEGRFLRLDQVSNQTRLFPRGNVPYLYGSAFLRYIARRYGAQALTLVSQRYGGCWSPDCWLPWGMNRALRKVLGKGVSYGSLYKDFQRDLEERYGAQKRAIEAGPLGLTAGTALTGWKASVDRPVFLPDGGGVLWLDADPYRRPALWRYDLATGRSAVELEIDGASGLTVAPDGQSAVMARLSIFRSNFTYQDLVLFRRDRRTLTALSDGLRTDNPAISPDGKQVAFEVNALGTRRLGVMDLPDTTRPRSEAEIDPRAVPVPEVWRARAARTVRFPLVQKDYTQVYTPTWSPDGTHLAFSYWQEGGYRDIVTLDVRTGELRQITHDRALDLEPRYSGDGKYLYFVSDRSGVYNLYAHDLEAGSIWQVTSVLSGVFNPAVASLPAGPWGAARELCAYVGFVAEGYRVELTTIERDRFVLAPPPIDDRPDARRIETPRSFEELPVKRYNPARTFFRTPLSFLSLQLPIISGPGPYGQSLGFTFGTEDIVGIHSLTLGLSITPARMDAVSVVARYAYRRLWNGLYLDVSRNLYPRGGIRVNGQPKTYDEEAISFSASTDMPILRDVARSATLTAAYTFSLWRNKSALPVPGPDDVIGVGPEVGRYAALTVGFSYSDLRRFLFSIGPERGRSIGLTASLSHPFLGSSFRVYSLRAAFTQAVGIPWPSRFLRNHTLILSYEGGISGGDLKRRGQFYVGGFPAGEDFLRAALLGQRPGQPRLRGYAAGATYGDQYHVVSAEYRFPLVFVERGYETLPAYLWRLHGAVYSDAGAAFFGPLEADKLKVSVGGELRLEGALGYYLPFMFQLGYAHGFMEGADRRVYFLLNNPL